jgi:hypothetical protein
MREGERKGKRKKSDCLADARFLLGVMKMFYNEIMV